MQTTGVCLIASGKAKLSVLTGDWITWGLAATSHILTLQREVPANVFKSTFDTEYLKLQIVQAVRHSRASRVVKHRWFKSPDLPAAMEIWLISLFQCQDMWNTRWCCTTNAAAEETTAGKMLSEVHARGFSHHYLLKGQNEGPWKGSQGIHMQWSWHYIRGWLPRESWASARGCMKHEQLGSRSKTEGKMEN